MPTKKGKEWNYIYKINVGKETLEVVSKYGFRGWLRDVEEYYEKQKDIDDIIRDWKEEYKIEL